jgi:uncharacterized protein (DUF488 family)
MKPIHTDFFHRTSSKEIFTLGTDRRNEEDFMEIIFAYDIQSIIDVRSFPRSSIPVFSRKNLAPLLTREHINYHFLGRELGGFRKGGYASYIITDAFCGGIDSLESIASVERSAILCAERFPWKCHRRWIAKELQKRGWNVIHIIDKGKVWIPR